MCKRIFCMLIIQYSDRVYNCIKRMMNIMIRIDLCISMFDPVFINQLFYDSFNIINMFLCVYFLFFPSKITDYINCYCKLLFWLIILPNHSIYSWFCFVPLHSYILFINFPYLSSIASLCILYFSNYYY